MEQNYQTRFHEKAWPSHEKLGKKTFNSSNKSNPFFSNQKKKARFFVLKHYSLSYYEGQYTQSDPLGVIDLSDPNNVSLMCESTKDKHDNVRHLFFIKFPNKEYEFDPGTTNDRKDWVDAIQSVLNHKKAQLNQKS